MVGHVRAIATSMIIPIFFLACAGFSIGLTFAPCYSTMCVERFFPYQTRVHIALYYALIMSIVVVLFALRVVPSLRRFFDIQVASKPILGRIRPTAIGRVLLLLWLAGIAILSTVYWLPEQQSYWTARGAHAEWFTYIPRIAWTGITGHWVDIWVGLTILPVGRNSLLAKTFHAQRHALLWAHKLLGYLTVVGGLIHGFIYYSFLAAWVNDSGYDQAVMDEFNPDNPSLTWHEAEANGVYSWFCLPTGGIAGIILIPMMTVISLPWIRRNHYNVFYFTHVIVAILILITLCIHASTNFYFLLPGMLLWGYDWVSRLRNALVRGAQLDLEDAGHGWYRIRLPTPQASKTPASDLETNVKQDPARFGDSPLQTYYLNISAISRFEVHPFTAVIDNEGSTPVILFRKSPERKKIEKRDREWTWKVADLFHLHAAEKPTTVQVRLEGPYSPLIDGLHGSDHILAIVGGTGITGAISLLNWWISRNRGSEPSRKSFTLIWAVRDRSITQIAEIENLEAKIDRAANVDFRIHDSAKMERLSCQHEVNQFLSTTQGRQGAAWVYSSGPASLLNDVEDVCVEQQRTIRRSTKQSGIDSLQLHLADYDV